MTKLFVLKDVVISYIFTIAVRVFYKSVAKIQNYEQKSKRIGRKFPHARTQTPRHPRLANNKLAGTLSNQSLPADMISEGRNRPKHGSAVGWLNHRCCLFGLYLIQTDCAFHKFSVSIQQLFVFRMVVA